LHDKTSYDAAIRYSPLLEELEFHLEQSDFETLFQLLRVPAFRERIYTIYFHVRDQHDVGAYSGDPMEPEWAAKLQILQTLNKSSGLPAECFRILDTADNLERIELVGNIGHDFLLRALDLARFSRRQLILSISPAQLAKAGYGCLSSNPEAYARYVKGINMQPELSDDHTNIKQLLVQFKELSAKDREESLTGLHLKDFRPTTTALKRLIVAFDSLEALELHGCRSNPSLRWCHGCEDIFVQIFAHSLYPNLSRLAITSMFISGGRLRKFIKRHSATLRDVQIIYVMLTDGSWRSIAQGLAKIPLLNELNLAHLRQKHATKNTGRPAQYTNDSQVRLLDRSQIEQFLQAFVMFFGTVQYLTHTRVSGSPPIYHEAKLFKVPNTPLVTGKLRVTAIVSNYAEISGW
jgi:hypothetical protein